MENNPSNGLHEQLELTIAKGLNLIGKLSPFSDVVGIKKLERKIQQEVKFLEKFRNKNDQSKKKTLKEEHVKCSNLYNLEAVIEALEKSSNPVSVLQTFTFKSEENSGQLEEISSNDRKLCIDIVSSGGSVWNKVIARNPKSLNLNAVGGQEFGKKSILQQVEDYVECAYQNLYQFCPPTINVIFHHGVSSVVANLVTKRGATFDGDIINLSIELDSEESDDESDDLVQNMSNRLKINEAIVDNTTLNIDITAMIAYVSALTNGFSNYVFRDNVLTVQAARERKNPVKIRLDSIFKDKNLITCESAVKDFKSIVDTLGGDGEKQRAKDFLENKLHAIVPDKISERVEKLDSSDQIKGRSKAIFGTGDAMKILTVTANQGFVRAAQSQGIRLAVIIHESSCLTESKMSTATEITIENKNA